MEVLRMEQPPDVLSVEIKSLERKIEELKISLRCCNAALTEASLDNNRPRIVIASIQKDGK